mgnify:FL=1
MKIKTYMMEEDKMARFCAKCGKQLGEQAAFCPACGAKVSRSENQQMQMNPQAPVKVHKNKTSRNLLAIAMVIVVLIVGVFGIKSLVSPGYMRPIKLVEKGFNDCDAEPIYESLSPETKKILEMSGCKHIIENLQSAIEEYSDGKDVNVSNIKTDIIVGNKKKIDKEELSQTLVDQYMVSQEEAEKASAAYIVDGNIVFKSGNSVVKEISTQFVVAKINMKWYLVYLQ